MAQWGLVDRSAAKAWPGWLCTLNIAWQCVFSTIQSYQSSVWPFEFSPKPNGKRGSYPLSPTFIGSCSTLRNQFLGNLPVNSTSPKSRSVTPVPSEPGSHATARASISGSNGSTERGRPAEIGGLGDSSGQDVCPNCIYPNKLG